MTRLIIAIIAGLLTGVILSIATDMLYSILGAFVIAVIAREKYMKAAIIADIIGSILALTGLIIMGRNQNRCFGIPYH
jgi:hypothetical protein